MLLTVTMCRGIPASGKSTWAKEQVLASNSRTKRINRDDLRAMLDQSVYHKDSEVFVKQLRDFAIQQALMNNYNVIIDDTNLDESNVRAVKNIITEINLINRDTKTKIEFVIKFFDVELDEAIRRNSLRTPNVPEVTIRTMYAKYIAKQNYSSTPVKVSNDSKLPKAVIVDIDGTVTDTITEPQPRGPYELTKVALDRPKQEVINLVNSFYKQGYVILFVSGRDSVAFEATQVWLAKHVGCFTPGVACDKVKLYMRPENDKRKDSIVKKEIFMENIHEKYYIEAILDDRDQVVDMWRRELGLTCLQVNYGNF